MITAQIKHLHSPDVANLTTYVPPVPDKFSFLLQVMVGPLGQDGEESFDVIICTPRWIAENLERNTPLIGRHHLIVNHYDYDSLLKFLEDYSHHCVGNSWQEVAVMMGRLGKWEFEDYQL